MSLSKSSSNLSDVYVTDFLLITFQYDFTEQTTGDATEEEIVDLMCQTDAYIQQQLQTAVGETVPVEYYGSLLEWEYREGATFPISISFLANATGASTGDRIDPQIIEEAMDLGNRDYFIYVSNYVLKTFPNSIFQNVTNVNSTTTISDAQSTNPWPNTCIEGLQDEDTIGVGGPTIDVGIGRPQQRFLFPVVE